MIFDLAPPQIETSGAQLKVALTMHQFYAKESRPAMSLQRLIGIAHNVEIPIPGLQPIN